MGRASQALKQVLEQYGISQNRLAVTLGIDRTAVFKWVHEQREPTSDTIVEITRALKQINPEAANAFVQRYLGEILTETAEDES
jgi:transcriptional regulator with XRE-family HTH domain